MSQMLLLILIAAGAFGLVLAVMLSLQERSTRQRIQVVAGNRAAGTGGAGLLARLMGGDKDDRRRKLEDQLREMQEAERKRKKKVTMRQRLTQAGLQTTERQFFLYSLSLGLILGLTGLAIGSIFLEFYQAVIVSGGAFVLGAFGIPLVLLRMMVRRRVERFLQLLPDAVELIVRGLRSGLPVSDALQTIANELPDPLGPEFQEVVDGQRVGIPIDQGFERMYERVPLPEVNFLSIVVSIQRETGGNLSEALENLSNVLRARKTMKLKVRAISQEAKAGAAIIGSLPILMLAFMAVFNPEYMAPLFKTRLGHIMLMGAAIWMTTGILVMRKMINFKV